MRISGKIVIVILLIILYSFNYGVELLEKNDEVLYSFTCVKSGINIRQGPGTIYPKDPIGTTEKGKVFFVLQEKQGWIKFRTTLNDNGWTGWTLKGLVKEKEVQQKPKIEVINKQLQQLYDSGLLKKLDITYNEAWVDVRIWETLDFKTKIEVGKILSEKCEEDGSTGRIVFHNNSNGKKIGKYSLSFGYQGF